MIANTTSSASTAIRRRGGRIAAVALLGTSIIALADSACGVGCSRSLPEGASSFTALELKSNFLGTAAEGQAITCHTRLVHGGRTTQVQDAEIANETTGKPVAHFRCTQLILYPRA